MFKAKILIVDDDVGYANRLSNALKGVFHVETCNSEAEFRDRFALDCYDLLIIDMRLDKNREGLELVREALAADPLQAVIVVTAYADLETYTDALESGAMTYLDKREFSPLLIARTIEAIVDQARMRRRLSGLEGRLDAVDGLEIIGVSPAIRRVRDDLRNAAQIRTPVILVGEPGTGKELVARNIHRLSTQQAKGPFVLTTCDRTGNEDFTKKLLGGPWERNSGQAVNSRGWIDDAYNGMLLLKGVEGLSPSTWLTLAQLIKSGSFTRPGSPKKSMVDTQIAIGITPGELRNVEKILEMDSCMRINLPALPEHVEDIVLIAQYTLQNLYRNGRTKVRSLRSATLTILESLNWPGNVRELKSTIEYSAIRADVAGQYEIAPEHLPQWTYTQSVDRNVAPPQLGDYQRHLAWSELALVEAAIKTLGTTTQAKLAKQLGYNDRYVFMRRLRKRLNDYPQLRDEFPGAAAISAVKKKKRQADAI